MNNLQRILCAYAVIHIEILAIGISGHLLVSSNDRSFRHQVAKNETDELPYVTMFNWVESKRQAIVCKS